MKIFNRFRRVYVDTSVVGGAVEPEFQELKKPFWDAVADGNISIVVSEILDRELKGAPEKVRLFFADLPESQIERVTSTEQTEELAARYIAEGVIGRSHIDDCQHIAIATVYRADCLVSLNFRHIVNANRIYQYNAINMLLGYQTIEIRAPHEVIYDKD
ncbi:hypothetical protein FACS189443_5750 [Planctomycetales bacterium]|nr:hypothetical protein FACS189443_5750 [Planctomycetales bacterium]